MHHVSERLWRHYIDNNLGIDIPCKIDPSFDALQLLLKDLGFDISMKKLVAPTTVMNCLGIMADTINFTLAIPHGKMQKILKICDQWRQKTHCDKCQLQSLLGSLFYVTKCVRTPRFSLNRLLEFLSSMEDKGQTALTTDARRDVNWFVKFMPTFNGVVFFDQKPVNSSIELDASLRGLFFRWGSRVYTLSLPLGYLDMNIADLEILNILVALRVWHQFWANNKVAIACDNEAVVYVLNTGRTRVLTLAAIANNIHFEAAKSNIELQVQHISGKANVIADLLSRWAITAQPQCKLDQLLPTHQWDYVSIHQARIDWSI